MVKAVFFDLDGTLLPMDTNEFVTGYFKLLAARFVPLGITPEMMAESIWKGCEAIVRNDGTVSNEERFWEVFSQTSGMPAAPFIPVADRFYATDFRESKRFTGENPLAREAVTLAGQKGRTVALATNPLFPMSAQRTRLSFVGLEEKDFALVTAYETDSFAKPNPAYYHSVCGRLGLKPEDVLMIGNDEKEDMWAASQAGLQCHLVTDCMIPCSEHPWQGSKGTFAETVELLRAL